MKIVVRFLCIRVVDVVWRYGVLVKQGYLGGARVFMEVSYVGETVGVGGRFDRRCPHPGPLYTLTYIYLYIYIYNIYIYIYISGANNKTQIHLHCISPLQIRKQMIAKLPVLQALH